MNIKKIIIPLLLSLAWFNTIDAQGPTDREYYKLGYKKIYFSSGFEGSIFSTALIDNHNGKNQLGTLRYTAFFHLSAIYNYQFSNNVGMLAGLGIKNIGYIDNTNDNYTVKRRLYTLNLPVGLKFGKFSKDEYFFLGGEVSLAVNYKEKVFESRSNKTKFNEWFSDRTPLIMPNVFVGYNKRMFSMKLSYYPQNFLNQDFVDKDGNKPYANETVNIMALTVGMKIPYRALFD